MRPGPVRCIKSNVEYLKCSYFCLYNNWRSRFSKVVYFLSLGGLPLTCHLWCEGVYTSEIHIATFGDILKPLLLPQWFYTCYICINLSFCDPCELWNTLLKFIIIMDLVCNINSNCPRWKGILSCHFVKLRDIWFLTLKNNLKE